MPANSTKDSVKAFLEQAGFSLHADGIRIDRVLPGKEKTPTKLEIPSSVFIFVSNENVASRVCKKVVSKDSPVSCELAMNQKVFEKRVKGGDPSIGTWTTDPEYENFKTSTKAKSGTTGPTHTPSGGGEGETKTPERELAPLVAHMKKELISRRNKAVKLKKEQRKRKQPQPQTGDGTKKANAETSKNTKKNQGGSSRSANKSSAPAAKKS